MEKQQLHTYPLFVALTRAPMMLGVTQSYFIYSFVPVLCLWLFTKNLVIAAGLFFILYLVGLIGCAQDERFFDIASGKWTMICPNKKIWGCNSYDPA